MDIIISALITVASLLFSYSQFIKSKKLEDFPLVGIDILTKVSPFQDGGLRSVVADEVVISPKIIHGEALFPKFSVELRRWNTRLNNIGRKLGVHETLGHFFGEMVPFCGANNQKNLYTKLEYYWDKMIGEGTFIRIPELTNADKQVERVILYSLVIKIQYYNKFAQKINYTRKYRLTYESFYHRQLWCPEGWDSVIFVTPTEIVLK